MTVFFLSTLYAADIHYLATRHRIQKARLKGLTKQLEDSKEMRKQLQEQISDLQKQLKCERDENKMMKKR